MSSWSDGRQGGKEMKADSNRLLLSGNHAVSHAVKLVKPNVMPVYPITPQTPILELITEFHAAGEMGGEIMTMESEHSAMAAAITASLTGVRVFTATASQGLLLMHEMLHYAAGARAPIVMFNVNRTLGSPWGFWPDQTDSLAQRDTGWIQYYCENGQESHDTTLQAYRVAEQVMLPVMVIHEAFYVSHSMEAVTVATQEQVDAYLPPFNPEHRLDPQIGESWGNTVSQIMFQDHRRDMGDAMEGVLDVGKQADLELQELVGRGYGIHEQYRCEGAQFIIATMGSMTGTVRDAVDELRAEGLPVGLLKIKLFRPFPVADVREILAGIPKVMVLDRNFAPGTGGILYQELKAALYGLAEAPEIHGYLAGVGGTNISPANIKDMVQCAMGETPLAHSVWKG
jgi:pyruvate/2-oxoacid:ferredoxin oxidoreductase alpha subunit